MTIFLNFNSTDNLGFSLGIVNHPGTKIDPIFPLLFQVLDLSSNSIESVPALCFEHQQGLNKLNLNSNAISYIDIQVSGHL
jgi:hypothetical protein